MQKIRFDMRQFRDWMRANNLTWLDLGMLATIAGISLASLVIIGGGHP